MSSADNGSGDTVIPSSCDAGEEANGKQAESVSGSDESQPVVPAGGEESAKKPRRDDRDYHQIKKDNPRFRKYVESLGLLPPDQLDLFWETVREPLPTSFRITGFRRDCEAFKGIINNHFLAGLPEDAAQLCTEISWYPEQLAWQINLHRRHIKRCDDFKNLREFIINETASGNISRQETVSMIPPLLLDVKPGQNVLDMCAAPGSKTAQIVDMLQEDLRIAESDGAQTEGETQGNEEAKLPNGLIVANDMELKRCQLLTHQLKRLQSPCVVVTNHDASLMPNVSLDGGDTPVAFDRILCDVPCSGDGTIRKNLDLWRTWHPHNALALHPVQYRILKRGLEMLAVGGRLVYSTCSMNPVENEAVISRVLNEAKTSVELVDCSNRLPGLQRRPGLQQWSIMGANEQVYRDFTEVPKDLKMRIRVEFFAPPNAETLHLERCMRVMPHYQNTGAFFIAVLEKKATLPWQRYGALSQVRVKSQRLFENEPLVQFATEDSQTWEVIRNFFHVHSDFPADQLFIRKNTQEKSRHIYLVSKTVKDVLLQNQDKLRIVNAGVRILTRTGVQDNSCPYRLAQEGLHVWMEYLDIGRITLNREEVTKLMNKDVIDLTALRPETKQDVDKLPVGSVVVRYEKPGGIMFELAAWRSSSAIRCYVAKEERGHFLRLLQMETM
ncbi:RNA cytosine C(5)-methyltransferase NSUN2-like isoform X2 [Paramacrobiotus metropolitanus]|uniref:RNA cytosine C(5)-methyltransferase NSUN2-like isoform X2 n=1 Tax=Paramacrobiotus metropolitanus TaxID=2943436 RepID=UPI002445A4CA|nr:RNA cytosine C(5)-methyltransferase NSUN2-like isoform X2 [Paramacrobiotus metropolitanus]